VRAEVESTPVEVRPYCPGCEPATDPSTQCVVVAWCGGHCPPIEGVVSLPPPRLRDLVTSDEQWASVNRRACDAIHRGK